MIAVVTGSARGIGRSIENRLRADGYTVIGADLASGIDISTVEGRSKVKKLVAGQPLQVLVNNAGITRDARLVKMSNEEFGAVLEVNLGAAYQLTRELLPLMETGSIVNISSRAYLGNFGQFNYSMSKGGLVGLTRALALRLAPQVTVNAIAPGLIGTEMSEAIPDDLKNKMIASIPAGRMGEPEEVAELVSFLCSERARYLTGEVIVLGGGRSLAR